MTDSKDSNVRVDWQSEMNRIATKHHVIVCWVAICLNPLWFIADYFTIPQYWKVFFVLRMIVTAATLIGVAFRKRTNISTELLMLIPVLGISLQNAYMWSVMDVPMLQKHTFAYLALFIGAGMLVLWRPIWTIGVVVVSLIVNVVCFQINSTLSLEEILINGGMLVLTVAIMMIVLIQTRYRLTRKEIIARLRLVETNKQLEIQKELIAEKNREITDSINYAKRIQQANLPGQQELRKVVAQHFVVFKPKDIVSGDFYFLHEKENCIVIGVVDCTGHGVPGAFMSIIGSERLDDAVIKSNDPATILQLLNMGVRHSLRQSTGEDASRDGMDIALCVLNKQSGELRFSGANRPLWIIRKNATELEEIKPTKRAIGGFTDDDQTFEEHVLQLGAGDTFYMSTDGYADTFGGKSNKKLSTKRFKQMLLEMQSQSLKEQGQHLDAFIEDWKAGLDQTDDILVMGVRL